MKTSFITGWAASLCMLAACTSPSGTYRDAYIEYAPVTVNAEQQEALRAKIALSDSLYDPLGRMITQELKGWNYHTDALQGTFHDTRASLFYAVDLLDSHLPEYEQRAMDIVDKVISLQNTDAQSPSCGVWPYFEEEPLATKRSPVDYNWADFNAVCLLDIYMGHYDRLSPALREKIKESVILAAHAVQKRNCEPGYTNIAIMGSYVTYMVSHLFNLPEMQQYAAQRLEEFYQYSLQKNGFTEYNSSTYTIVALDELNRMQRHIVEPEPRKKIDQLYEMGWEMIARHYHAPSGQWVGPQSRSYNNFTQPSFYGLLKKASQGRIDVANAVEPAEPKMTHYIPERLIPYFTRPEYPRIEQDLFENLDPQIEGYAYLTEQYALSTASRSSLWNQRRPLTAYWGSVEQPHCLQLRFLHDGYDFSTVNIQTAQQENRVVAALETATDGGDKHITIGRIENGRFKARDLRLRLQLDNCPQAKYALPARPDGQVSIEADGLFCSFRLLYAAFGPLKGHWEEHREGANCYLDFVFYQGAEKEFDLTKMNEAAAALALAVGGSPQEVSLEGAACRKQDGRLQVAWDDLRVEVPLKPESKPIKEGSQWYY